MNLDAITRNLSAFATFAELLDAKGGYRPTVHLDRDNAVALADAYDAAQAARGDDRRVYRRCANTDEHADYEVRIIGSDTATVITGRARAEQFLRDYATDGLLDVHIHPTLYTDSSRSTAYARGGDSLFDAVVMLRRLF